MAKRIISLSGRMGSGKSELAKIICRNDPTFKQLSYGTEIKKVCMMITGRNTVDKNVDRPLLQQLNILKQPLNKVNEEIISKWLTSSKTFFDYVLKNGLTLFKEDFFANKFLESLEEVDVNNIVASNVVIDDMRFLVEYNSIREKFPETNFIMLYCDINTIIKRLKKRDGNFDVNYLNHISEKEFKLFSFNEMYNTDLFDLETICDRIL